MTSGRMLMSTKLIRKFENDIVSHANALVQTDFVSPYFVYPQTITNGLLCYAPAPTFEIAKQKTIEFLNKSNDKLVTNQERMIRAYKKSTRFMATALLRLAGGGYKTPVIGAGHGYVTHADYATARREMIRYLQQRIPKQPKTQAKC